MNFEHCKHIWCAAAFSNAFRLIFLQYKELYCSFNNKINNERTTNNASGKSSHEGQITDRASNISINVLCVRQHAAECLSNTGSVHKKKDL